MPDRIARVWNGTSWEVITSTAAASNAVVVYQSASPSGPVTGQVWIDSDDSTPYVYTGSSWQSFPNLSIYATLASPALTGIPTSTTAAVDTNTTQIATTAYVVGQGYAKLLSPSFTGIPTSPTASSGTSTTQIATTAFVANNFEKSIPLQASAPSSPSTSDLWVDSSGVTPILRVYNGTSWVALASPADDDQNILANRVFSS